MELPAMNTTLSSRPRSAAQRIAFVLRVTLLVTIPLILVIPAALGWSFIAVLTAPGCAPGADPAMMGWRYENVGFLSSEFGRDIPAYFIPADTPSGLTAIFVPTGGARGGRLDEMRVFHDAGVNVLTYDARTCLAPVTNSLGYLEADAVGDALAYLGTRPDVDPAGIGLFGFSAGGAAANMAAARFNDQIAWLVSEGGYHDFNAEIDQNALVHLPLGMGSLFRFGALIGYRVSVGVDMSVLSPVSAMEDIDAPVLLIYGTDEPSLAGAREMARIGGENVTLWEVPGATHGSYIWTAPEEYARRINDFVRMLGF